MSRIRILIILLISICTSEKCLNVLLADDVRDIYIEKPQK